RRRHTRFSRDWSSDVCSSDLTMLPKNRVKLLLNLVLIASSSIPRGGKLTVDAVGEGETMGFRLSAEGPHAKVQSSVEALLTNGRSEERRVGNERAWPGATGHR